MRKSKQIHSNLILEEASTLAKEWGLTAACEKTGVSKSVLKQYMLVKRKQDSKTEVAKRKNPTAKYSDAQKLACLKLAEQFRTHLGKRKAWIEAGRRTGVNGRSIEMQYDRGIWRP